MRGAEHTLVTVVLASAGVVGGAGVGGASGAVVARQHLLSFVHERIHFGSCLFG